MTAPAFVVLAVDAAIAVIALEAVALAAWQRSARRRLGRAAGAANLAAGACLMIALRASLADAVWPWILVPLAAAGVAHGLDLIERRRASKG